MAVSKAQQKAVAKYEAKTYDKALLRLPKGRLDEIKAHAEAQGQSVNSFIGGAISKALEQSGVDIPNEITEAPDEIERRTLSQEEMVATFSETCRNNISHDLGVLNADGQRKAEKIVERILEKSGDNEDIRAFLGKELMGLFNKLNLEGRKKLLERAAELVEWPRSCLEEDTSSKRIFAMLELLKIDRQGKARDEIFKLTREDKYRASSTEQKSEAEKAPESEPPHEDHMEE